MKRKKPQNSIRFGLSGPIILFAFLLVFTGNGYAQMTVLSGTTVKILATSTLNSSENVVVNSGGTLDVQGTLVLKKDLVNGNASFNSLGTGTVVFSGTVAQSVSGNNIFQDLTVSNAAGVSLLNNTHMNGVLNLTSGLVTLGANNLRMGPLASVSGAPSAANMVVASGAGELRKDFASPGSFTYPVGDVTGTAEYSPVTLAFTGGTFGANPYAGVTLTDAQYPGTATSYISRYWTLTTNDITGYACNATFQYVNADVTGTEADIFCFRVNPAPFTAFNVANAAANTLDAHGLSSLGTFTGNLGDGTVPPTVRSLQDKVIAAGPDCADATQTLLIAGNGTFYQVTATGDVTHIAGVNIIYYPGTSVVAGGHMLGKISSTFCAPFIHPAAQAPLVAGTGNKATGITAGMVFRIYPNPTPGDFTLELNGELPESKVHVEILGILGERILSTDSDPARTQKFSLTDKPTGMYLVHVTAGGQTQTEKIIKQ